MLDAVKLRVERIHQDTLYTIKNENVFHVIWPNEGSAGLLLDKKTIKLEDGQVVLLMPENTFQVHLLEKADVVIIAFSVEYLQVEARSFSTDLFKLFITHASDKLLAVDDETFRKIALISDLLPDVEKQDLLDTAIMSNFVNAILLLLIKSSHAFISVPDKYMQRIHDFFLLIFQHSAQEKAVSFYAEKLHISPKRLNQVLHAISNHSASYFIQEHIIVLAKRELLFSDMNINQIAMKLGFEDVAYFSRFFKKWIGLSPEKYRKSLID